MGSSEVIDCVVFGVVEVESSIAMINWMGPNGADIMNNSRTMIIDTTISDNETIYISSLQFTYLIEGDNGTYTCNFIAGEISISQSVELPLTSMLSLILQVTSVFRKHAYINIKIYIP